jgi:uncharacterized protein YqjF (DUF2071 family)
MPRPFLTARWESLVMLNWDCPRELLEPLVPAGTVLDAWRGRFLVSVVGFLFLDTRLRGIPVPCHRNFEEVNLRFYVRCGMPDGTARRAVVFVRELVPRRAIAALARRAYNEPYLAVPMRHRRNLDPHAGGAAEYGWRFRGDEFRLTARVSGSAQPLDPGSEAEFVTEHYWGYTRQRDGGTLEYQVEHPPWTVWTTAEAHFEGPAVGLYGAELGDVLASPPSSAFVALGSEVAVHPGSRLAAP